MDQNAKYKVWGRMVWTPTLRAWGREMVWCHVVCRLFRYDIDALLPQSDTLPQ
jgi:hypothetical protein